MASSDMLREQVARAVWEAPSSDDLLAWDDLDEGERESERRLADAAIGVVLAAVKEQIESIQSMPHADTALHRLAMGRMLATVERLDGEAVSDGE